MHFKDPRYAYEYERKLKDEGYPGFLLNYVLEEVKTCTTILDVGAGTGFFSIPLAQKGKKIRAIEPSEQMAAILKGKITGDIGKNINIDIETWEEWKGSKADGLICVHSVYAMKDLHKSLLKMKDMSDRALVIVRASQKRRVLAQELRKRLKIQSEALDFYQHISLALDDCHIDYSVYDIFEEKDLLISDLEKETDYYCLH